MKSLDLKLARIIADRSCSDFILADAKDADMAYGLSAPGQSPEHYGNEAAFRTLDEYRQIIREVVAQGLVDIMLMSVSTSEVLTLRERIFDKTSITPAIRANDTTDIWLAGSNMRYSSDPSMPFRTASLDHAMCGKFQCSPEERKLGADLGLYSITYNNATELDRYALNEYKAFRLEAEEKGFRHFLEVFSPNSNNMDTPKNIGKFVSDHIVRTLAGVPSRGRPVFLKIPYYGPAAMESLVRYDSSLVVGILGGSAGTTFDAFQMLWEARKYGARVALYGRKINNAEHQLSFIYYLRAITDGNILPEEATRAYHADLRRLGIPPRRTLEDDLKSTDTSSSYSGVSSVKKTYATPGVPHHVSSGTTNSTQSNTINDPDFSQMTTAEKVQYNLERWKRIIG
ncbi:MAG: hypothetical protein LBJ67_12920 [Planctomycetaceae bacterium]|jgi:hypothetical protein|nr:hypothetical protein [Planctomycetaceae bacterium]